MSDEIDDDRVAQLFAQAKDLAPEDQALFLERECRNDPPEVRRLVEKLLAADRRNRKSSLDAAMGAEAGFAPHALADDVPHRPTPRADARSDQRDRPAVEPQLSLEIQRQIDECCRTFEQAWKDGRKPRLEEFLTRVSGDGYKTLLRELVAIELHYRSKESGTPVSSAEFCQLHPQLLPELAEVVQQLNASSGGAAIEPQIAGPTSDLVPTIPHEPHSRTGSRGLHIRCPHCSNPVELLTDTPLESITCRTCGSTFSLVDQGDQTCEAPTLKRIGRFELVSRLGLGAFGTVWKARDTELDRTVAIKIPRKGQLGREEVEQFFKEARSAAQLRHPNIVTVHEVGREGETIFIVSDLIRGVSLSDWLSGAVPQPGEIARLMAIIADALQHAHDQGVIHRDLKPSNILLDDVGQPHVMDFGLAKREVGEIAMTIDGQILGTPAYMSPEQAGGHNRWVDRRSDIYSLGVILFRMLTGELPFRGNAQMQIHQRVTDDAPDPRKLNRYLPRDLCTICVRCLERDPNRRFASAKELADELRRFLRKEPILSRPISRIERTIRWAKRNPALTVAIGLTLTLAIAGPTAAIRFRQLNAKLRTRIAENDNLIKSYKHVVEDSNDQTKKLKMEVDVLKGKANPFTFWPPQQNKSPRQNLATSALKHSTATLATPLQNRKFPLEASAGGNLGLAILSDAIGESAEAKKYYQQALETLVSLHQENARQLPVSRALAVCNLRLSQLNHDTSPETAAMQLESARKIYEQLANEHVTDSSLQIDWFEVEWLAAIGARPEKSPEYLKRIAEIHLKLDSRWPNDPEGLYRLACYLTDQLPILAPADNRRSEEASGATPAPKAN